MILEYETCNFQSNYFTHMPPPNESEHTHTHVDGRHGCGQSSGRRGTRLFFCGRGYDQWWRGLGSRQHTATAAKPRFIITVVVTHAHNAVWVAASCIALNIKFSLVLVTQITVHTHWGMLLFLHEYWVAVACHARYTLTQRAERLQAHMVLRWPPAQEQTPVTNTRFDASHALSWFA